MDTFERLLTPVDRAAAKLLTLANFIPSLARVERRWSVWLITRSCLTTVLALCLLPALLVFGPLLLGVPHLLSDLRSCGLAHGNSNYRRLTLLGTVTITILSILSFWWSDALALPLALASFAWFAAALLLGLRDATRRRNSPEAATPRVPWLGLVLCAVLPMSLLLAPTPTRLVFAHLHNLLALLFAGWLLRREERGAPPQMWLFAVVGLGLFLLLGASTLIPLCDVSAPLGIAKLVELDRASAVSWLAPNLDERWSLGLVASFALLQTAHYDAWLFVIPHYQGGALLAPGLRQSYRAMRRAVGWGWLFGALLLWLALLLLAVASPFTALVVYLTLALFHGYLELSYLIYCDASNTLPNSQPRHSKAHQLGPSEA